VFALLDGGAAERQVGQRRDRGDAYGKCQALIPGRGDDCDREIAARRIAEHDQRSRVHAAIGDEPAIGAKAIVEGAGEGSSRSEPVVHHVYSRIGGQCHRGGEWKITLRGRATDVAAAVEVEHGAIGVAGPRVQRDGGDTAQVTDAARHAFQLRRAVVEPRAFGVADSRRAKVADECLEQL
jgi:hypothetical protein